MEEYRHMENHEVKSWCDLLETNLNQTSLLAHIQTNLVRDQVLMNEERLAFVIYLLVFWNGSMVTGNHNSHIVLFLIRMGLVGILKLLR